MPTKRENTHHLFSRDLWRFLYNEWSFFRKHAIEIHFSIFQLEAIFLDFFF